MGTKIVGLSSVEDDAEFPAVPPGFESLTPFYLKNVDSTKDSNYSISSSLSESHPGKMEINSNANDTAKKRRCLRRRGCINYGQFDHSSGDESDAKCDESPSSKPCLPKGVVRGCSKCSCCQKVTARCRPEHARRPALEDAPVFYPSEEEFKDTMCYIASIRPSAEKFGICRIVPPPSWKPPCPLKEKRIWENCKFATRLQRIDQLQNRKSMRHMVKMHNYDRRKRRRCMRMGPDHEADGNVLCSYQVGRTEAEKFGFEPGPDFTLAAFEKYADDFKAQYFKVYRNTGDLGGNMIMPQGTSEHSVESVEGEYWRIVEKPTEEIEVVYGADIETGAFGSGFSTTRGRVGSNLDEHYVTSGWNLNNLPRLPGSVLRYESGEISGVLVPWLYVGMCFSSFCWHVEDHHLYSLNYMHWGAPKMWYGVPEKYALNFEEAMKKHLPDLFEEQPDLLHKLVTQLSPSILKSEGVPVYRCVQKAGEFILTFPRAYHSGFNSGFNCAEAVNVAPVDWLPHGQNAVELYRRQCRKTSISHDKLLLGAARDAVRAHWELNLLRKNNSSNLRWKDVCGKSGILPIALKMRMEMELAVRERIRNSSQIMKMDNNFDTDHERECSICMFDLHLSAAGCSCSSGKFACLNHAKQLCSCSWSSKYFLFRYSLNELSILIEALEGKLSAVYRWARSDLGLSLTSYRCTDSSKALALKTESSSSPADIINLSDDEGGDFKKSSSGSAKEAPETNVGAIYRQGIEFGKKHDSHKENCSSELLPDLNEQNSSCCSRNLPYRSMGNTCEEDKSVNVGLSQYPTIIGSISNSLENLNKCSHQEGPPVARVLRSNWNVETLEYGAIHPGKLWCNSRAIFPKGFRSRARYISVLDPTGVCNYVSEILDAGKDGPLFMVYVENTPSEVFIHISSCRSWDLVRERVNQEISKRHKLENLKLPPLQPPGSLDGDEMFGLSSPSVIRMIESMDKNKVCDEYWKSQEAGHSPGHPDQNATNLHAISEGGASAMLMSLLKKANKKELWSLHSILSSKDSVTVARLLCEELQSRQT